MKPLYIRRDVQNPAMIASWAKSQGFTSISDHLHVTICYSKQAVDWDSVREATPIIYLIGGIRDIKVFGENAVVLTLDDAYQFTERHQQLRLRTGISHDYPAYVPHITITYSGLPKPIEDIEVYNGPIVFGPEILEEIADEDFEPQDISLDLAA
jgi:hypothetical protein